ncbi:MAG: helix-turn-helix transcriptional regulator [Erysipelotrichaceae bacterium]|jgi:DNA-binding PadR family transcriptional regulator|nr:helix-turn-helix transcriptional regulator [Bacillota bacterium]NLP22411.1 PadR family transcriptional regulator [Erysipelotrichaceae bacterium]HCY06723.1 PadR family transcriptional regulator [Erysipelotrichaceae bacterium]
MENITLTEAYYYILLSLFEPLHGYGIMQKVETMSNGRLTLAAGTLYGALTSLIDKEWIEALPQEKGSRKKEYIITALGKEIAKIELKRLEELVANGKKIMEVI